MSKLWKILNICENKSNDSAKYLVLVVKQGLNLSMVNFIYVMYHCLVLQS